MQATLTGDEAVEAIKLYSVLGARGARFDGGRVARSMRSVRGRATLAVLLIKARRPGFRPGLAARLRSRAVRAPRSRRARQNDQSPSRPSRPLSGARNAGESA